MNTREDRFLQTTITVFDRDTNLRNDWRPRSTSAFDKNKRYTEYKDYRLIIGQGKPIQSRSTIEDAIKRAQRNGRTEMTITFGEQRKASPGLLNYLDKNGFCYEIHKIAGQGDSVKIFL